MDNLAHLVAFQFNRLELETTPLYLEALQSTFERTPPLHGCDRYSKIYFELAKDATWFANSLVTNSEREGYGSSRIYGFSLLVTDKSLQQGVRSHSLDESRHSRMFVHLLDMIFPDLISEEQRTEFYQYSPRLDQQDLSQLDRLEEESVTITDLEVADEVIQLNFVEIRSLVLQLLLRPFALAYCPPDRASRIVPVLDALIRDEVRHIHYSATYLQRVLSDARAENVKGLMHERQGDLNDITTSEVRREKYELCGDCYLCPSPCSRQQESA